ncbi:two-partner secretion domain-containing protein [Pseudomonas sp. Au-Pse12]|uniref:two-partner secretion domain-containing protein n=1 Tax=Pseudomonas sp. Au-Pse12 TaxID=2906459 RepID=UPI001E4C70B2|nr:GLUG motif-containing protein [Pseudomonas sp. Au-Pse12]MCE4053229.1 filamentous hemagglutinin N-terminal domain-containing protein [Pseudomonas sp. Au-Pse12]
MNKIYALVWNQAQGCWNVTHEGARRRRRSGSGKGLVVAVASLMALTGLPSAFALPTGGEVVSGSADFHTQGSHLSINQQTDKLITQWQDFNVQNGQSVTFNQPTSTSIALNRVVGVNGSQIHGQINANGRVFLINPNGVVFGQGSQVNVGGLVATTRDISDADFKAGNYKFTGDSAAEVVNQGSITAADGGSVALLGAKVTNQGSIKAQNGRVALAAGDGFTVGFDDNQLLDLHVDSAALNALVHNAGLLKADGGQVLMTAKSAGSMLQTVVNNQGTIEANTLSQKAGRITLDGGDVGVVSVDGSLHASALDGKGDGGVIETRGATTRVLLPTKVNTQSRDGQTGTWKIASNEVKVGSFLTATRNTAHADTVSRNLATTHIELASGKGDVAVENGLFWFSGNQLTLSSAKDIRLDDSLFAGGANARVELNAQGGIKLNRQLALTGSHSSLGLNYGNALVLGQNGGVTLSGNGARFDANGDAYAVIQNALQLQAIDQDLAGRYVLGNSINSNARLTSIGGEQAFSGIFEGLGNTLSGMTVNSNGSDGGLFASSSGSIGNLKLASMTINGATPTSGTSAVGGLVGRNSGKIANVSASNLRVNAKSRQDNLIGGLVGSNAGGSIDAASMSGVVQGNSSTSAAGGLVGENRQVADSGGTVTNSSADVRLTTSIASNAEGGVGGLVGVNHQGLIAGSSSSGAVSSGDSFSYKGTNLGGLVGYNQGGRIEDSQSSVAVSGNGASNAGGLVGRNESGRISDSGASGGLLGKSFATAGGLVGLNHDSVLRNVTARGSVNGGSSQHIGGLVGQSIDSQVSLAEAFGLVQGASNSTVGGLIGYNTGGLVANSMAWGNVVGKDQGHVGGLIGYNAGDLKSVEARGDVSGGAKSAVGGLVGTHGVAKGDSLIDTASAKGKVSGGSYSMVGGLVGQNHARIVNALASGNVTGSRDARLGGLAGVDLGDIRQSAAFGNIQVIAPSYASMAYDRGSNQATRVGQGESRNW